MHKQSYNGATYYATTPLAAPGQVPAAYKGDPEAYYQEHAEAHLSGKKLYDFWGHITVELDDPDTDADAAAAALIKFRGEIAHMLP